MQGGIRDGKTGQCAGVARTVLGFIFGCRQHIREPTGLHLHKFSEEQRKVELAPTLHHSFDHLSITL